MKTTVTEAGLRAAVTMMIAMILQPVGAAPVPAAARAQRSGLSEEQAVALAIKPEILRALSDDFTWEQRGNGGYLIRAFVDLDGNGRPETLLTSSLATERFQSRWMVFKARADGTYAPYAEEVWIFVDGLRLSGYGKGRELIYSPGTRDRKREVPEEFLTTPYLHYRFQYPKVVTKREEVPDQEVIRRHLDGASLRMETDGILLADYAHGMRNWQPVKEWRQDMADTLWREEDWERAQGNKSFTAQAALAAVRKIGARKVQRSP